MHRVAKLALGQGHCVYRVVGALSANGDEKEEKEEASHPGERRGNELPASRDGDSLLTKSNEKSLGHLPLHTEACPIGRLAGDQFRVG